MKNQGFIFFALILFMGCAKSEEPLGIFTEEERSIEGEFNSIYVEGSVNVVYTPSDSVRAITGAYVGDHENILTTVEGNSLLVDDVEGVFPDLYRTLQVSSLPPRRVLYSGSGNFSIENFPFQNLTYNIGGSGAVSISGIANSYEGVFSGTGDLRMHGEGGVLSINHQGTGTVFADSLIVESCKVEVNGPGDAYIHVLNNMTVIFNGTGNVYYTGPVTQIVAIYNGSGELIRLPD